MWRISGVTDGVLVNALVEMIPEMAIRLLRRTTVETICLLSNTQRPKKEPYITLDVEMEDSDKRKQELGSFRKLDDGFKKIVITMDDDPFSIMENGYKKINAIDFLLNDKSLEEL